MHANRWRSVRVVWREHEGSPILAAVIRCVGWAGENVMPFQEVLVRRVSDDVRRRGFGDSSVFFCEALCCCGCSHRGGGGEEKTDGGGEFSGGG